MNMDDEILARESDLRQAQLTGDVQALDRLLDDQLVFTAIDGTLAGKADDLTLHRSGACESRGWTRSTGGCCTWARLPW
jgi:hypothetical protein